MDCYFTIMKTIINSSQSTLRLLFTSIVGALSAAIMLGGVARAAEWNGPSDWAKFDVEARRAMWVWNPVSVAGNKQANKIWDGSKNASDRFYKNYKGSMDMFFDFCENKSIRVVYMFGGTYQWSDYSRGKLDQGLVMKSFLEEANDRGIQIWYMYYLNDDRDTRSMLENTNQILEIAQAVDKFNKRYPKARFAGIHCDQEPNKPQVYPGLLDNTKKAFDWVESTGSDLLLSQALRPKWFNQSLKWNGETKTMNQHMQDCLHHSVLMAYNDKPETVYKWSKEVVDYATKIGRKAAIGSELADLKGAWPNSDKETWWEEVRAESDETRFKVGSSNSVTWEDMMHEVVKRESGKEGFDRLAIHTYSQYFYHWFGDYPRDYILSLPGKKYDSRKNNPDKVRLTKDVLPLCGVGPK